MKKKFALCCLMLFYVTNLFAITEEGFQETYTHQVKPFYDAGEFGTFQGAGGTEIAYARVEAPDEKGAIVILHGMAESMIKYAEVMYDLKDLGYSFYLMDHRGMGFSGRLLDDPDKIYVKKFDDYVQDVKTFVETVVNEKPHKRLILISHSMGGCVAARYLEQYPQDFTAAVLSSPMLKINTHEYPQIAAYMLAVLNTSQGLGSAYVPGDGTYVPDTFVEDTVTHSYERWALWEEGIKNEYPEVRLGGVTYSWVKQ
ncbi:MAG: alpha/beta fold hydrolase, partial [Pseudomonadota bacterium]